jgi:hypothetical protein
MPDLSKFSPPVQPVRRMSTHSEQFSKHAKSIPNDTHLRARLVGPIDGNLRNPVVPAPRDIQKFQVESIAVDSGDGKEILRYTLSKQLETALRVGNSFKAKLLSHPIEGIS